MAAERGGLRAVARTMTSAARPAPRTSGACTSSGESWSRVVGSSVVVVAAGGEATEGEDDGEPTRRRVGRGDGGARHGPILYGSSTLGGAHPSQTSVGVSTSPGAHARPEHRVEHQRGGGDGQRDVEVAPAPVVGRVQHDRRQQDRPRPEDEHAAALAVAEAHEAVVEVVLVGHRHAGAPAGPPQDREGRVDDRHPEDHERDEQRGEEEERLARERRVGVAADGDRGRGHEQAEQQRAGVAHEDLGRVEVVRQEAEARAEHGGRDDGPTLSGPMAPTPSSRSQ